MTVELAVVDLSCLVLGVGETCIRALLDATNRVGARVSSDDARAVLGLPLERGVSALFQSRSREAHRPRAEAAWESVLSDLVDHYTPRRSVVEVPGARDTLAALRVSGVPVAVSSNLPSPVVASIVGGLDWHDRGLVATVVTCDEVDDPRPRPGMIVEAMRRVGARRPERVVTVGDTPAALAEGTLAPCGMVVGALYGSHRRDELELRPHTHLVERLVEVVHLVREVTQSSPKRYDAARAIATRSA